MNPPEPTSPQAARKVETTEKSLPPLPWRTTLNFWLDLLLACSFGVLVVVTCISQLIFPVGLGSEDWTLWGGTILDWRGIEFGALGFLATGVIIHVMLHWDWVCQIFARLILGRRLEPDQGERTLFGVIFLAAVLLLIGSTLVVAQFSIKPPPGESKLILPGR